MIIGTLAFSQVAVRASGISGWTFTGTTWSYYDNGSEITGWISYKGNWYYLNSSGDMAIGWVLDNGKWYFLNNGGDMAVDTTTTDGYTVDVHGIWDGQPQKLLVERIANIGTAEQVVIVTTDSFSSDSATIQVFEKSDGQWKQVFSKMLGVIGMNGFGLNKVEGDGKSPVGKFTFGTGFGKNINPGTAIAFRQVNYNDYWVDDSNSAFYNTWQTGPANGRWNSAEKLLISAWLYNYAVVINYNTDARTPWKGSAIFFHEWRAEGSGTAGCIATTEVNLLNIMRWLNPAKNPVIIQGPMSEVLKM